MPRQSRAADQRRLAEEHAKGIGQGAPRTDPPKRARGRPPRTKEERVSKAWDVLRAQYTEEAHRVVAGLKRAGLTLDDLVAMEIAELVETKQAMRRCRKGSNQHARLHQVAMQSRKQLMRLLVLRGAGIDVNDAEIRIPEGLDILERPMLPIIGDDVLGKPDLSKLPERYR